MCAVAAPQCGRDRRKAILWGPCPQGMPAADLGANTGDRPSSVKSGRNDRGDSLCRDPAQEVAIRPIASCVDDEIGRPHDLLDLRRSPEQFVPRHDSYVGESLVESRSHGIGLVLPDVSARRRVAAEVCWAQPLTVDEDQAADARPGQEEGDLRSDRPEYRTPRPFCLRARSYGSRSQAQYRLVSTRHLEGGGRIVPRGSSVQAHPKSIDRTGILPQKEDHTRPTPPYARRHAVIPE